MITSNYVTRTLKHLKNSILIMIPVYGVVLLMWFLFFETLISFQNVSMYGALLSAWIFVFINYKYQLPHYNISSSATEEHQMWVYKFDLYIITIVCIVVIFNW